MVSKENLSRSVFEAVEKVVEPRKDWRVRNDEESVMARCLVVNVLFRCGCSRGRIVELTGWKKSCVVSHINGFEARKKCSRILSVWYASVVRELRANALFEGLL
jgi:hypothetical protein